MHSRRAAETLRASARDVTGLPARRLVAEASAGPMPSRTGATRLDTQISSPSPRT